MHIFINTTYERKAKRETEQTNKQELKKLDYLVNDDLKKNYHI